MRWFIGDFACNQGLVKYAASISFSLVFSFANAATPMFGAGILKPGSVKDCTAVTNRSNAQFWTCGRDSLVEDAGSFGSINIRLEGSFFVLQRDLSESPDRAFDDYMTIAHSLPFLLGFACYPNSAIGRVPKAILAQLNSEIAISFDGEFRRRLTNSSRVAAWEVNAEDVYRLLGPQCEDHLCDFALRRDKPKFWECNRHHLREYLGLPSIGLMISLEGGDFKLSTTERPEAEEEELALLEQTMRVMTSIGCHPELKLVEVPISDFDLSIVRNNDQKMFKSAANLVAMFGVDGEPIEATFPANDGYAMFSKICQKLMR